MDGWMDEREVKGHTDTKEEVEERNRERVDKFS